MSRHEAVAGGGEGGVVMLGLGGKSNLLRRPGSRCLTHSTVSSDPPIVGASSMLRMKSDLAITVHVI